MDRRSERGEFYPGGDRSGGAPAPQQSDKVDRVNLGEVGESYTLKDVKKKVNQIVRVIAPAAVCLALAVVRLLSYAATAPLEDIPNTAPVVTNEEDAVAIAAVGALGAAVSNRVEAAEGSLQAEITGATNAVVQAALRAAEAESNRVDATFAKRSEIPAAPDLSPYALKSELPQDYLVESDITNFATRAWINSQNYAREGTVYTRLDAQDLAINATSQRIDTVDAALGNRLETATNRVWQGVRAASNELARADARLDAKIDALELTGGMTRLWSSDATTYQDATGTVWQVQVVTGLWTVVHSWTTTGLNWEGPWWWGAEGAGEDYYEGPGWYISSSTLTPMRMSEDPYEREMVVEWSYWEEQDEQEHSITTTCSRTVQWLTNAVNRVAYTNDMARMVPGDYETVSNRAMTANNYTDTVAADIRQNYIPISGGPIYSSVDLYLNDTLHEQGMLLLELPDGTSADAQSFVGSSQITNQGAVAAAAKYTDAATNVLAQTRQADRITDGTNIIDAAGNVYKTNLGRWVFPQGWECEQPRYMGNGVWRCDTLEVPGEGEIWAEMQAEGDEEAEELEFTHEDPNFSCTATKVWDRKGRIGRIALTNDIPQAQEWPAELVYTNTPLIFADGEDTNVTSLALHAQPTNYTSLSFLSPVSYYLPNRFSLLELGHDYQIAAAQWFQVGRYLFAQNPENIVFVGGNQHRSLQDYLDACSPQTMADLLSCYIPTNGGGRIHGDLTIDGRLTAGELITITNSDIHAKGFKVENKVLTADGLMASNGMVRLNCARFVIGFGTPRIHLETNDLSAITYGGTWEHPAGSVFSWQDSQIQAYLAGDIGQQDIELRNPYVRYMDVKNRIAGWKIKGHEVNNGPLKHFTLDDYRTHHFTDADVGSAGIEFTISSNAHVRIVYDFASAPPSAVYFLCGRDGNDLSATMLSNGTELLAPTAGAKTLLEIEHLSGWTFIVKETPLTYENTVMPWMQAQEEEP